MLAVPCRLFLIHTSGRATAPGLHWSSVSVQRCAQPQPCPSSVPVGRSNSLQPPPCRICGGRLRTGPSRRSSARVATTSAGVAVFAAIRRRVRHAATCRPPGLNRTVTPSEHVVVGCCCCCCSEDSLKCAYFHDTKV